MKGMAQRTAPEQVARFAQWKRADPSLENPNRRICQLRPFDSVQGPQPPSGSVGEASWQSVGGV